VVSSSLVYIFRPLDPDGSGTSGNGGPVNTLMNPAPQLQLNKDGNVVRTRDMVM